MNMDDYKSGFDAGKVAGKMDAVLESCNRNAALTNARWAGARKALEELQQDLHNLYANSAYCQPKIEDGPDCEQRGLDCDDCIKLRTEQLIARKLGMINDC